MRGLNCNITFFGLLALVALNLAGCCKPKKPQPDQILMVRQANAIFNPPSSPVLLADCGRTDWPVAYSADSTREETAYREQFIDIFGWGFDWDDGFVYRRFESDRVGQSRR